VRVIVCGSRAWQSYIPIRRELANLPPRSVVIHGAAAGADALAALAAKHLRLDVEPFPADWYGLGNAAGPIRNEKMLREGRPDLVLAFHHDIEKSRGTKDMVRRARESGVPVKIFTA
jgi:hypothetical protein